MYRASWASMYRLIFNQSSWRDGTSAVGEPPGELLVAGLPLTRGSVPGVVVRVGMVVGWGDGGRSCRGAVGGVEVVRGAVCFGVSWLRGLGSPHPPRSTEAPGSENHCLSSSGDAGSRGSVCGGGRGRPWLFRAWISRRSASSICGERRCLGMGRCSLRAPPTPGEPSVSRCGPPGVRTSW